MFSAFDSHHYNVRCIVVCISQLELAKPKVESTDAHLSLYHLRQRIKQKYLNNKIPKLGTLKIKGWCVTLSPLPFYIKKYLKAKEEELWKLKYFTMQKYNLKKKSSNRRNQNPSRYYYNSIITNLKFQHKPKYHLSKILMKK